MMMMECYVFRNKSGDLFLSIIEPTISKQNNMRVAYPQSHPVHLRKRLPIQVPGAVNQPTNRIALDKSLFPEVMPLETKRVVFSITDACGLEEYCDALNIDKTVIIR